jgi:hypothetical protein
MQSPPDLREYESVITCPTCPVYEVFLKNVLYSHPRDVTHVGDLLRESGPARCFNKKGTARLRTLNSRLMKLELVRSCRYPNSKTFGQILEAAVWALDQCRQEAVSRGYFTQSSELTSMTDQLEQAAGKDVKYLSHKFSRADDVEVEGFQNNGCKVASLLYKRMQSFRLDSDEIETFLTAQATFGVVLSQLAGLVSLCKRAGGETYKANYQVFTDDCTGVVRSEFTPQVVINHTVLTMVDGDLALNTRKQYGDTPVFELEHFLTQSQPVLDRLLNILVAYNCVGMLGLWFENFGDVAWDEIYWRAFAEKIEGFSGYFNPSYKGTTEMSKVSYNQLVRDLQTVGVGRGEDEMSLDEDAEEYQAEYGRRAQDWWEQQNMGEETVDDANWRDWLWVPVGAVAVWLFAR